MMDPRARRAFYEYHAALMEPCGWPRRRRLHRWPPDRRDARSQRPAPGALSRSRDDDLVCMASESGVLPIPRGGYRAQVAASSRASMLLIDLEQGRIIEDEEIKAAAGRWSPIEEWLERRAVQARGTGRSGARASRSADCRPLRCSIASRPSATRRKILPSSSSQCAMNGDDPIGSMGTDTPHCGAVGPLAPALRLLQAELRAGDQPHRSIRSARNWSCRLVSMIGPRP